MLLKAGVLAEPALVDRERELEELQRHLTLALQGKGNTVLISGEAGSGKTRLTNEFLTTLKDRDVVVLSGYCLSNVAVPYFPFAEAFDAYFSTRKREDEKSSALIANGARMKQSEDEELDVKVWLRGPTQAGQARQVGSLSPEAWKDMTFATVSKALIAISKMKPTVLFLEDVHWADSASLSLLHYISRVISLARVLVLATYRSEELNPDEEGHPHPLVETMRLMHREYLFEEIKLANLSLSDVSVLAEKMVGGRLHPEFARRLAQVSLGNPLFVVESMRLLSENHSLVEETGRWRLSISELYVPKRIRDVILRRVGLLKPFQRRVLDLASLVGDKFDVELLSAVLGVESLEVLEALNDVARNSCLVCCDGDLFRFDHAHSREAILGELSQPLKRGYHVKIAQKLEDRGRAGGKMPIGDLAYHYAQAGNKAKTIEYSLAVGEDALARFSNSEAIKGFKCVLSMTEATSGYSDQRIKAMFGLGNALQYGGFSKEALKTFEGLSNFAESGAVKLRALRRAIEVSLWSGGLAHVLELAAVADDYSQFDRLELARVRMAKARAISNSGKIEEALKETKEALRIFEEEGSLSDVAQALFHMTNYYARVEKTPVQNALAIALRSVALFREFGDRRSLAVGMSPLAMMFMSCGHFEKASEVYATNIKIYEKIDAQRMRALQYFWLGVLFETKGILKAQSDSLDECIEDFKTAVSHSLEGAQIAEKTDDVQNRILIFGNLVRQYVKLKEMEKAESFFRKLEKTFKMATNVEGPWLLAHYFRSKAIFFAAKGQWAEANRFFEESLVSFKNSAGLAFPMFVAETRIAYAEALVQQKLIEESKMQLQKANVIIGEFMRCKEKLRLANIHASLTTKREVGVGEEFGVRIDLVNAAMNPAVIVKLENVVTPDLKVVNLSSNIKMQNGVIEMNAKKIGPFQVESVTLTLQAEKVGTFTLNPRVIYDDHLGKTKTCGLPSITITVRPTIHARIGGESVSVPILPDRVHTGFTDLDALLFGGIPKNYGVALTSPSIDERKLLIRRFVEAGTKANEIVFNVATEAATAKALVEKYPSNFFLFLCNLQADSIIQSLPNVFKLNGVENLTDIDIALTKAFRMINTSVISHSRICIEIVSDVLLQHHAVNTRRWLSALIPTLKLKGFTILAVVDPSMHPPEELQAILGVFDGEIRVIEKETPEGVRQTLRIRKLLNQRYLDNEIVLDKEKLSG